MSEDSKLPNWAELVPAYGRDYKTQKEVRAAWEAEQDFRYPAHGGYTSIRDQADGRSVVLRYNSLRSVMTYAKAKP